MLKKVIVVTLEAPLPFSSAAARWYYVLLKQLEQQSFEVELFCACKSPAQALEAKNLFPKGNFYPINHRRSFLGKLRTLLRPFSYMISPAMMGDIRASMARGFDVIHLEQNWACWVLPAFEPKSLVSIHYLACIDFASVKAENWHIGFVFFLQRIMERRILRRANILKACSPRIQHVLQQWYPEKECISIPFGIEPSLYEFLPDEKRPLTKTVLLMASMNWHPGKTAAIRLLKHLWPGIKAKNPDAKLQIVGWCARQALQDYLQLPDVEILENVASTTVYFNNASLLLYAPEQGTGMKIKVLEAMLLGTPVVTTTEGIEGLVGDKKSPFALLGENNQELINQAHLLLNDRTLQNTIRKNARLLVEECCSPKETVEQIVRQYRSL